MARREKRSNPLLYTFEEILEQLRPMGRNQLYSALRKDEIAGGRRIGGPLVRRQKGFRPRVQTGSGGLISAPPMTAVRPAIKPIGDDDPEAISDAGWFDTHPKRRYGLRRGWAVRRVSGIFLRVPADTLITDDGEATVEAVWLRSAWSKLDVKTRNRLMRKARKRAK